MSWLALPQEEAVRDLHTKPWPYFTSLDEQIDEIERAVLRQVRPDPTWKLLKTVAAGRFFGHPFYAPASPAGRAGRGGEREPDGGRRAALLRIDAWMARIALGGPCGG